jgi:hypothetical protein
LGTVLTGRYFWEHPSKERLCRVDLELPTVYGGQVNLVKTGAGDPKKLAEPSA